MKTCSRCKIEKPLDQFYKRKSTKDGLYFHCKDCQQIYNKGHYKSNKQYYIDKSSVWKKSNAGANYGLSKIQYEELFAKFDGLCWICKERKATVVDHDHLCCSGTSSCGKCVRGALCHNCNSGIGFMKDDVSVLAKAIEYLNTLVTQ